MSALTKLASSIGRRDKEPNKKFAKEIAEQESHKAIDELVENLNNKDKNIQSDCIEVLYETGYIRPDLIANYYKEFSDLLRCKNNRLIWGAMIALDTIASVKPKKIFSVLSEIVEAIAKGSVITKDAGVGILAKLSAIKEYKGKILPLLMEELKMCPPKQLPMYAEKSLIAIDEKNKKEFIELIKSRISGLEKESQRKRIKKILKEINIA